MIDRMKCFVILLGSLCFFGLKAPYVLAATGSSSTLKFYSDDKSSIVLGGENYQIDSDERFTRVVWLWGNLEVKGSIDELFVLSGHVKLLPTSSVSKSMTVVFGSFEIFDGAKIDQKVISWKQQTLTWQTALLLFKTSAQWGIATSVKITLNFFATFFLTFMGILLFRAVPALRARTEMQVLNWRNLPWAILGCAMITGMTVLLVVSLIGWVFLPFWFFTLFWLFLISYLGGSSWVGHRLAFWNKSNKFSNLSMFCGVVCLQLIWCVDSGITPLIFFLIWSLSWGALVRSFFVKNSK